MSNESPSSGAKVSLEYKGFPATNHTTWKLIFDAASARAQAVASLEDTVLKPHEERLSQSIALDIILMKLQEKCMEADIYSDRFLIEFNLTSDNLNSINDLLTTLVEEITVNPYDSNDEAYLAIIRVIKNAEDPKQALVRSRAHVEGVMSPSERPASPMDEIVKAVLRRDPDTFFATLELNSAQAAYDLALALIEFEQPDLAVRALKKAIELDPNHAPPHMALVELLVAQNRSEEAHEHVTRVIAGLSREVVPYWRMLFDDILDGEDVPVSEDDHAEQERQLVILGELRTKIEQDNPQVIDEDILTALGNTPLACVEMSKVYQQGGRNDLAVSTLKRALELSPHYYFAIRILVPLLLSDGQEEEARRLVSTFLSNIADKDTKIATGLSLEALFKNHTDHGNPDEKEVELPIQLPASSADLAQLLMEASERNSQLTLDNVIHTDDSNVRLDLVLHRFRHMLVTDGLLNETGFINPDFQLTSADLDLLDTYLGQDLLDITFSFDEEDSPPLINAVALIKKYCS